MNARQTLHSEELVVGGYVPLTTTDLPGKLSAVIFCQGCPWRCVYCHNTHLIDPRTKGAIAWNEILSRLARRRGLLDAVVFSGGEPLMQRAVLAAIKEVKSMGFEIGLHTAGQYPARLKEILPDLSWIGMDIKAPFGRSEQITRRPMKRNDVALRESAQLIIQSGISHEFRTTYHPDLLSGDDLTRIAKELAEMGAAHYVLQCFRQEGCSDDALCKSWIPPKLDCEIADELRAHMPGVTTRGFL